jgi:hypothetical protein
VRGLPKDHAVAALRVYATPITRAVRYTTLPDATFLREPDSREYALLAKVKPPDSGRPLFLICGQTAITNRAAASYLRDNYRKISSAHGTTDRWCIVLRVVAPSVYSHQMTELAADASASAFSLLIAAEGQADPNR